MNKVFYSSAGLGDQIYSLPVVKLLGGGIYVIGDKYEQYLAIKPLLEAQSYISECKHISEIDLPRDFINLDKFRNSPLGNKVHLVDLFLDYFGFPKYDWSKGGWLENIGDLVPTTHEYMVINVTPRYRDKIFQKLNSWKKECYKQGMLNNLPVYFMGQYEDYVELKKQIECKSKLYHPFKLLYFATEDLYLAASVIKWAKIFSGNQSSLLAIRQALGLPYRFEQSPNHVDCRTFSKNETVINPLTRKLHLFIITIKKLLDKKQ